MQKEITPLSEIREATSQWLTDVLQTGGYLRNGVVASVQSDTESSQNARNARLHLIYQGADEGTSLPSTLFLKLCDPTGDTGGASFGSSEVNYYATFCADIQPSPAPCCYHAAYSQETGRYHLLLEDLSESHTPSWDLTPTRERTGLVVEAMARLHARWWDNPALPTAAERMPTEAVIGRYVDQATGGLEPLLEETHGEMTPAQRDLIRRVFGEHRELMIRRAAAPGMTVIHGDPNPGNILSPLDPDAEGSRAYLIDRQLFDWSLAAWLGVSDLAYMMVHWWPTEQRRALEQPLLERYHQALVVQGVRDYSLDDLWNDYRLSAMQSLYVVGSWCADPEERVSFAWVWCPQLQKTLMALEDLNCAELLNRRRGLLSLPAPSGSRLPGGGQRSAGLCIRARYG